MKAPIWRALMAIGMKFHHFAAPKPPRPSFKIIIPSRISPAGGSFKLVFYVPEAYLDEPESGYNFPMVVNFHGGGFTLGTGTDDARWASSVVNHADAVFVSVEYRLAPEYPFSVGVEDGTDALIYLASHAEELRIDPHRIALSGFSAGGNFAFTVPLMLHDLKQNNGKRSLSKSPSNSPLLRPQSSTKPNRTRKYANSSTLSLPQNPYPGRRGSANSSSSVLKLSDLEPTALEIKHEVPDVTICCIVSFYPPTDFRRPREEKRATNPQPEKNLPPFLTNLFDKSYLHPKACVDMSDPYLSPACASDAFLRAAYPEDIVLYTCEYDMLNVEGVEFGERLAGAGVGKRLHGGLIKGVPHAFDKKPNPLSFPKAADRCYAEACAELKRVFGGRTSVDERRQLEESYPVERFEAEEPGDTVIGEHDRRAAQREDGIEGRSGSF
ncbi:Alpha/Beta hydrolase protein [Bisporella sp. PMI_857]|nr:Alpha/Beta hydrolase protein [Bisporella sp. PMI_857]